MSENTVINDKEFLTLRHSFTYILAGATGAGKTILVRRLLKKWKSTFTFQNNIDLSELNVLWIYGQYQELYKQNIENVNVTYTEYLPKLKELKNSEINIIVMDDMMFESGKNENMSLLFTRGSHHLNLSVIFIVQNFFHRSKQMRTISLNMQYIK